jgi:hypothetical protein
VHIVLKSRCHLRFRYAECQLDAFSKLKDRRIKSVRKVLNHMPPDIQSTYMLILNQLRGSDEWVIVERTLALICDSARPVSVTEVSEFAILDEAMTSVQPDEQFEDFVVILSLITS